MADGSTSSSANNISQSQQQGKQLNRTIDGKLIGQKQSNMIHRTTTECLRLSASDQPAGGGGGGGAAAAAAQLPPSTLLSNNSNSTNASTSRKAKTSSFQITSVTVGTRTSADNGEDSADDLDESHTDDNSRITDLENETPSFSEDTFSKEDVFFSSNALGTAPVIPTSSQYGLAILAPDHGGPEGQTISDVHVSVTDSGVNIVESSNKHDPDVKDGHHRNERFKVVKIESTEPFKRGRWVCMDYLDHTAMQQTNSVPISAPIPIGPATKDSGLGMSVGNIDVAGLTSVSSGSPLKSVQTEIHLQNLINSTNLLAGQSAPPGGYFPLSANSSPGQTLHQPLNSVAGGGTSGATSVTNSQSNAAASALFNIPPPYILSNNNVAGSPAQPMHQLPSNTNYQGTLPLLPSHSQSNSQQSVDNTAYQQHQPIPDHHHVQGQSQPAQFYAGVLASNANTVAGSTSHVQGQTLPAGMLNSIVHGTGGSSAAAPPTSHPLNFVNSLDQQQKSPSQQPMSLGHVAPHQPPIDSIIVAQSTSSSSAGIPSTFTVQNPPVLDGQQCQTGTGFVQQTTMSNFMSATQGIAGNASVSNSNTVTSALNTSAASGNSVSAVIGQNDEILGATGGQIGTPTSTGVLATGALASPSGAAGTALIGGGGGGDLKATQSMLDGGNASAAVIQTSGGVPVATEATPGTTTSASGASGSSDEPPATEDTESASGTSAVAIDNKIEQAMDLVKSHLMFAVREEVEVLKEKIAELMDRINQLEVENTILKANATQETLIQLSSIAPLPKPPANSNPQNGPIS